MKRMKRRRRRWWEPMQTANKDYKAKWCNCFWCIILSVAPVSVFLPFSFSLSLATLCLPKLQVTLSLLSYFFFSVHQLCFPKCVGSECISVCCRVPILSPNEGACFPSFDFWFCIHLLISFIRCKLVQLASATASLRQRTFWWCFVSGGGGGGGLPLLIKT